jgi:hypothetical protein
LLDRFNELPKRHKDDHWSDYYVLENNWERDAIKNIKRGVNFAGVFMYIYKTIEPNCE